MRSQCANERTPSLSLMLAVLAICNLLGLPFVVADTAKIKSPSKIDRSASRALSMEQRISYQRRLEEVNWRHRLWPAQNNRPKPSLDEVLPYDMLQAKVEDYLRKSTALATYWQRPITAEQLQAEINRMVAQTRQPEQLAELFTALDNDAFVIAECLARPLLADGLVRGRYAYDQRIHGELRSQIDADLRTNSRVSQMKLMTGNYTEINWSKGNDSEGADGRSTRTHSIEMDPSEWNQALTRLARTFHRSNSASFEQLPVRELSDLQEDEDCFYVTAILHKHKGDISVARVAWEKRSLDGWLQSERQHLETEISVPSDKYSVMNISSSPSTCTNDTWSQLGSTPYERDGHTAVWTGTEMIVWGGRTGNANHLGLFNTGGRYNPSTDTWTQISNINAPSARRNHTAVWTGSMMIVWGGNDSPDNAINNGLDTGGRYNPSSDTWTSTSTSNAPSPRNYQTAVWTGTEMIVWGGSITVGGTTTYFNTGGRYNPSTNSWAMTSTSNAPDGRTFLTAVWTGSLMIVWGGQNSTPDLNTGGRYNPATDSWLATNSATAPETRRLHVAVWTGTEMIIASGVGTNPPFIVPDRDTGGRYNPSTDTWIATPTTNAPKGRNSAAVWTGSEMIVWGGFERGLAPEGYFLNTGSRYNPSTNTWTSMTTSGAPSARELHIGVWDGSEMMIFGGSITLAGSSTFYDNGARYDPTTNSWGSLKSNNTPIPRLFHSAIWTGSEMIVWGGLTNFGDVNTGGRYSPVTDSTIATTLTNAPTARGKHTAVWTGTEMIVWGGRYTNTGGRYNPSSDTWVATDVNTAPIGKTAHTAVWTGTVMVVWGGFDSSGQDSNNGSRYNPTLNSWTATSTSNAPPARDSHTVVWTGSLMVVWGGLSDNVRLNTGGRYDPSSDTWSSTNTPNAPTARFGHTAVWTGNEMIVWGGDDSQVTSTGGRYNPSTDSWTETSIVNAPSPRRIHTAVWTGTEMIVWGGDGNFVGVLGTGGRYNSATDSWVATATNNAPQARAYHTAVFTGTEMLVFAGNTGQFATNSGGRYCASNSGACTFSLAPMSHDFTASAQSSTVNVTAGAGCNWTAVSNSGFIVVNSGNSGSGNGAVNYSVTANAGAARTGTMTIAGHTFTVTQNSPTGSKAAFDFDADRRSDLSLWNPSNGQWTGPISGTTVLGQSTDMIVPADYDGDIKTDIAVWRPSTGMWTIIQSASNQSKTVSWGINGDVPAPADYDGDGKADIAIWRPSGVWFIINSSDGSIRTVGWGVNGDVPVPGDYDGDGKADIAIWRPSNGTWYVINSSNSSVSVYGWGVSGDKAVPADYDGDGKTDVAIWRPSSGTWYIINSTNGSITVYGWGLSSDIPVPADYDGDIKTDIAVWRPSTGTWYIVNSSDGSIRIQKLGSNGQIPVPSAFIR